MSYKLTFEEAQKLFDKLEEKYEVYAPKRFVAAGRYSDTDIIKYAKVTKLSEIEHVTKSTYPMKEVIAPIQQSLFYFTEDEYRESKASSKPMLVFARACDINAIKVQTRIYLGNGGYSDIYYKRMHERVKFILMECTTQADTCFCVSMGSNATDNYSLGVKFTEDSMFFEVKDSDFDFYFNGSKQVEFKVEPVKENELKVTIPEIKDRDTLLALKDHPMWKQYNGRCISCGACTLACSTCTCFTTRDLTYGDNDQVGERRRVASSCQIDDFTTVAGGGSYRKTAGDRMRYKMLHKFHDYKARFQESHMCVGCGRCTERCPELISITHTLNLMADAIKEIEGGKK